MKSRIKKTQVKHFTPDPEARVRYPEGTESDLVDFGTLRVKGNEEKFTAFNLLIILAIVILIIAFLVGLFYMRKKML